MRKLSQITESFWGDVHKRSRGDEIRKEDVPAKEVIDEFAKRHRLKEDEYSFNPSTGTTDFYRSIDIDVDELIDGHLPFKFGKVEGTLYLDDVGLTSLENAPNEVTESIVLYDNKLKNFIGGPEIVGKNFSANFNRDLESLDGSPKEVKGDYSICFCSRLKDIKGISPVIGGNLEISKNCPFEDDEFRKYSNIKGQIIRK